MEGWALSSALGMRPDQRVAASLDSYRVTDNCRYYPYVIFAQV
jgi:hypothetical protein